MLTARVERTKPTLIQHFTHGRLQECLEANKNDAREEFRWQLDMTQHRSVNWFELHNITLQRAKRYGKVRSGKQFSVGQFASFPVNNCRKFYSSNVREKEQNNNKKNFTLVTVCKALTIFWFPSVSFSNVVSFFLTLKNVLTQTRTRI